MTELCGERSATEGEADHFCTRPPHPVDPRSMTDVTHRCHCGFEWETDGSKGVRSYAVG